MKLDIPSEGFAFKITGRSTFTQMIYRRNEKLLLRGILWDVDIIYVSQTDWVLISIGDNETPYSDWETVFAGRITTQEDLKKVLSMVLIND